MRYTTPVHIRAGWQRGASSRDLPGGAVYRRTGIGMRRGRDQWEVEEGRIDQAVAATPTAGAPRCGRCLGSFDRLRSWRPGDGAGMHPRGGGHPYLRPHKKNHEPQPWPRNARVCGATDGKGSNRYTHARSARHKKTEIGSMRACSNFSQQGAVNRDAVDLCETAFQRSVHSDCFISGGSSLGDCVDISSSRARLSFERVVQV